MPIAVLEGSPCEDSFSGLSQSDRSPQIYIGINNLVRSMDMRLINVAFKRTLKVESSITFTMGTATCRRVYRW